MDLWIRSQDKASLVKINNVIGLKYNDNKTIIANYQPDFTDKYDGYYEILGTYKSKERALEVLDEIQRLITDLQYLSYGIENDKFCSYRPNVYEMPEE